MNTSYMTPYMPQSNNILPPQQILQANGKASIDMLRMSPNSSALIADQTAPIVWKCVSDSLGNVTAEPYDIIRHKSEEEKTQENINALILNMNERLSKLEQDYEQSNLIRTGKSSNTERKNVKKNNGFNVKSTEDDDADDAIVATV